MAKSPDAFRTISEVSEWLGVQAHVLRFWESKFTQVKPVKRAGGRRYYRPADMQLLGGIKKLLHDDGLTIKGVQKILRENGIAHVAALSQPLDGQAEEDGDVIEAKADDTVVRFETGRASPGADGADRPPAEPPAGPRQIDLDLGPDRPPAPAPKPAAETSPDDPGETGPERPAAPDPSLPSFLQPPAIGASSEPRPEAPRARRIEIADPPADDLAEYTPGVLSRLAGLGALPPNMAPEIALLAEELRGWLERHRAAGLG